MQPFSIRCSHGRCFLYNCAFTRTMDTLFLRDCSCFSCDARISSIDGCRFSRSVQFDEPFPLIRSESRWPDIRPAPLVAVFSQSPVSSSRFQHFFLNCQYQIYSCVGGYQVLRSLTMYSRLKSVSINCSARRRATNAGFSEHRRAVRRCPQVFSSRFPARSNGFGVFGRRRSPFSARCGCMWSAFAFHEREMFFIFFAFFSSSVLVFQYHASPDQNLLPGDFRIPFVNFAQNRWWSKFYIQDKVGNKTAGYEIKYPFFVVV